MTCREFIMHAAHMCATYNMYMHMYMCTCACTCVHVHVLLPRVVCRGKS